MTEQIRSVHFTVRAETLSDGLWYIAQGLEYDLVVQARSLEQAEVDFVDLIRARIQFAKARGIADPMASIPDGPLLRGAVTFKAGELNVGFTRYQAVKP